MPSRALRFPLVLSFVLGAVLPLARGAQHEFPLVAAEQAGMDPAALEELAGVVESYVETGRVCGAELCVIQGGRTVLRRAFGAMDRERGVALEPGAVYDVRSMTKPIVGALAQELVDRGELDLSARVASILPEFARVRSEEITLRDLLAHRAGFEWSACMEGDSLRELAACAAELGPTMFWPGTSFLYSNTGSNVLGAALAERGGTSLEELVTARVLRPLGLGDTFSLGTADEAQLARCVSGYAEGEDGELERVWSPADGPPLPFLQGAQGLGSTTTDYARFLTLWMHGGQVEGARLLSPEAVERGLRPASLTELPTTFPDRRVYYGQHWKLWTPMDSSRVEIFGHGGSNGTFAWAWPERDLIVLYFSQTVLTRTGIELEAEIDRLLLRGPEAAPAHLRPYVGTYWNEEKGMVRVVSADQDGELTLDVVGTGAFALEATDDPLLWEIPGRADFEVRFERDADGAITVLHPPAGTGETPSRRLPPDLGLPSVDELMASRPSPSERLGVFRMTGHFLDGEEPSWRDVLLSDGAARSREEVFRSRRGPQATICSGDLAWTLSAGGKLKELSGVRRSEALLGRLAVLVGDWRESYERVEVLHRTRREDRTAFVVQAVPKEGRPVYYVVDGETGRAVERLRSIETPFGSMGKRSTFGDYRQVEGVWIPFRWEGRFASASLGAWTLQYEEIETHLDVDESAFEAGD